MRRRPGIKYQASNTNPKSFYAAYGKWLSISVNPVMRQQQYPPELPAYLTGGRLDMSRLLQDFQTFWRENSDIWQERFEYKEAAPHLILQAFLQRVVNGGGRIIREWE